MTNKKAPDNKGSASSATGLATILAQAPSVAPYAAIPIGVISAKKSVDNIQKGNAGGAAKFGAIAGGAGIGITAAGLAKLFGNKSTKEYQRDRWNGLNNQKIAGVDKELQVRNGLGDMAGKMMKNGQAVKWNFEDAKEMAKTNPGDFRGVYGNFQTFGNDWDSYSPEKRDAIVKGLIDKDLYYSDKGDVLIKDAQAARDFAATVSEPTKTAIPSTPQRETRGLSPRKADPKKKVNTPTAPPVNISDILPKISQPEPFAQYDNAPTTQETTTRNKYKDELLAQLMSRI